MSCPPLAYSPIIKKPIGYADGVINIKARNQFAHKPVFQPLSPLGRYMHNSTITQLFQYCVKYFYLSGLTLVNRAHNIIKDASIFSKK